MFSFRLVGIAFGLSLVALRLEASCGSATCPYDTRSPYPSEKGSVRLGYTFEYIDQDQPRISTHKARVGEIRGHHDEVRSINRIHRFSGTVGVTNRLSLDVGLPIVSRSHRHVHNHRGSPFPEGWDFTNLGDLSVESRYAVYKPVALDRPTVYGIAGIEFPTGKSRIANSEGDEAETGITPGSHSWDYKVGGATLQHFKVPMAFRPSEYALMPFFTSLTYQMNGKGREDYRLGNTLNANIGLAYPVLKSFSLLTQLNYLVREKDAKGLTSEEIEKTGGEYWYASPGIQWRAWDTLEGSLVIQLPVHQRVDNIQLTSDYNLATSLSWKFHL